MRSVYAVGAVTAVTALIALVPGLSHIGNVSMLYLPAVLVAAVRLGRGPAIAASLASFLAFDFFFVEPRFQFGVGNPSEWASLILLLFTAVVASQVAADQLARASDARAREREAIVLYDVVRLMAEPDLERSLHAVAERLRAELDLAAVAVELRDERTPRRFVAGDEAALHRLGPALASRVLSSGRPPTAAHRAGPGRWVRVIPANAGPVSRSEVGFANVPILGEGTQLGSLQLLARADRAFSPADDRLLSAAAAQLGTAIVRARLRRDAAEAEALRRTDELKSALLDAVSHDLRTPLASILAAASSLRQRDVSWSDDEREEFLASIEDEARRLDRLVGNLLDLSRIEAGALRPQLGWYDAGALVDDVLGRLRHLTAQHRISVRVPEDLPPVPLDYVEIDQVLSNLIENAAKFAPAGTAIDVAVRRDGDSLRFEVRDEGPGIAPSEERELFASFHRMPRDVERSSSGVGLGLAVAKRLVEAHGGRIWFERPSDGGARFVFVLPLAIAA
ncbi:MAG: hypothetical protein AUH85_07065 [Chloroflexi bacterium 13_1_40CM_4_68_4]|nr:MAG: hypothetical protein AUH85_07065 [Chloroflexi bacterium 13_1_40CM_4_68_4]